MKRIILILAILFMCGSASALPTITDMNTNTPVPLGEILTISGNYDDPDANVSVYCKFLTKKDGIIVERLTDERTFLNGDFYSQRRLEEPLYKRDQYYTVSVTCLTASGDTNFTVGQRDDIEHIATEELEFLLQRDNMDTFFIIGSIVLFLILVIFVFWFFIKRLL